MLKLLKAGAGWGVILFASLPAVLAQEEAPYLEPDFSARIIDVDAISLEGEERAALVAALATLAGAEGTGNLVRMKAIAIALRLDSMHPAARPINDLLIAGEPVLPEEGDGDGPAEAVALIEETAIRLRNEKIEQEDAALYPYLMDIAAGARQEGAAAEGPALQGKLHWELVLGGAAGEDPGKEPAEGVPVDAAEGPGKKSPGGVVRGAAGAPPERKAAPSAEGAEAASGEKPGAGAGTPDPATKVSPVVFKGRQTALRVVVFEGGAEEEERAVPCRISAKVSDEAGPEEGSPFYSSEGIHSGAAEQLAAAARLLRERYSLGPLRNRIELELVSLEDGRTLPLADSRIGVAALFLFDALLTGEKLDEDISVGGSLPGASGKTAPRGRWGEIVAAAGQSGARAVIVSRSAETDLTDLMIAGEIGPLLRVQVVELSEAGEVGAFLGGKRDANSVEAMGLFGEIQDLLSRLDLNDLLGNLKVQERLTQVMSLMPNHLSAKLLLGYGRGTLPQRMSLRGSLRRIDETIEPARDLGQATNSAVIVSSQDDLCADSLFGLRRLRTNLAEGSLAYCDAAIDFVELLREYLKLSNRTTAGAVQQATQLEAAGNRMKALREGFEAALETP